MVVGLDGNVFYASPSTQRVIGYEPDVLVDQTFST